VVVAAAATRGGWLPDDGGRGVAGRRTAEGRGGRLTVCVSCVCRVVAVAEREVGRRGGE
jgi:hypothetical protein